MDGNRRWAREKGLTPSEGHKSGADNLNKIARHVFEKGISDLTVYAFSTENWKRDKREVEYIMQLVADLLSPDNLNKLLGSNVKIRVVGTKDRLSQEILLLLQNAEELNPEAKNTLWLALSYGSRLEIFEAAKSVAHKLGDSFEMEDFKNEMWSANMPDFDMVIRTGGERRLSNFFLWQSAYAELFFTDTHWPDFEETELNDMLEEFKARKRRFGK